MKYLPTPCPRCGNQTMQSPINGYSKCATCRKKCKYIISEKVDESQFYSLAIVGRTGQGMKRMTFFIDVDNIERLSTLPEREQSQTVRFALDKYFNS